TDTTDSEGRTPDTADLVAFSDLARASYCPRQLYYARRDDDRAVPDDVAAAMELAYRYPELRAASDDQLREEPLALDPDTYRERLTDLTDHPQWAALADPPAREVYLAGKDCHGIAYKILPGGQPDGERLGTASAETDATATSDDRTARRDGPPPIPTLVSPGAPPERGVWEPQSVRAVAAAKALAWEREREIPAALVEYPTHATVRRVRLTVRRTAAYRRALRTTRGIDGPPPRLRDSPKCGPCEYRSECGVETKSLRSRLGL
ncbi:MAG: hypothetical protein ABEH80_04685, partial [Halobaculum sp.]